VDLAARRSGAVDLAEALARRAGFGWVAAASSWEVLYLPYPYWPPTHHTGRISSGGAILSRYPLSAAWIERLPKPRSQPAWYRAFYPWRYLMGATVDAGQGRTLRALHVHLEAFDPDNRQLQAGMVATRLCALAREGRLVFGGDLNTVPPSAPLRHHYPDEPRTDHRGDRTYSILQRVPRLTSVVPDQTFTAEPEAFATFPAHRPNRMLDHLFVAGALSVEAAVVGRAAGNASDHLPLHARLRL
jgi:endonuclease/exonuclease/phosphatase family metal-dependent hydrolase